MPDEEARYATTFLKIIAAILENTSTTYAIQVQFTEGALVHHGHGLPPLEYGKTN